MRIAILSRNKNLHSIRRLLQEARKKRIQVDVINPLECQIRLSGKTSTIFVGNRQINRYDAVLPRIGASITDYGLAVVKQFEMLNMKTVNSSLAIAESRDKMRCLQVLTEAGVATPATAFTRSTRWLKTVVQSINGMPGVLKVLKGTQGVGVMLVHSPVSMGSVLETLHGLDQDVLVQEFIAEGAGRDYRAFVIGNRVVAAMRRTAPEGEFRSNIHRGGQGRLVELPRAFKQAALKATKKLGLEIAGVDIMESRSGPMVIEVNSSPGFEGIEKATGLNIAKAMIEHMVRVAQKSKKRTSRNRTKKR